MRYLRPAVEALAASAVATGSASTAFSASTAAAASASASAALHGFAVEVAERRIFGGALRVAYEGHEAGGDVGAGAYAGADALFAEFAACGDDGYGAGGQVGFFGDGGYVCCDASESTGVRCRFAGFSFGAAGVE